MAGHLSSFWFICYTNFGENNKKMQQSSLFMINLHVDKISCIPWIEWNSIVISKKFKYRCRKSAQKFIYFLTFYFERTVSDNTGCPILLYFLSTYCVRYGNESVRHCDLKWHQMQKFCEHSSYSHIISMKKDLEKNSSFYKRLLLTTNYLRWCLLVIVCQLPIMKQRNN